MKNLFLFLVGCAISGTGFSQQSANKLHLTCSEGKITCIGNNSFDPGSKIELDVSAVTCCEKSKIRVFGNMEQVNWAFEGGRYISLPVTGTEMDLKTFCGDDSSTCKIKLNQSGGGHPEKVSVDIGNTLQDAIQLSDWWKKKDEASARQLLAKYKMEEVDFDKIKYLNPYKILGPEIANATGTESKKSIDFSPAGSAAPAGLSGIFSPTLVIDALGKFAAKRFKEELTIAFLQKFRDTLMSKQYMELRLLLPRTFHTFVTADIFNYAQFYQSLHENAQTDLYNLPENTAAMLRYRQNNTDAEKHLDQQLYEPLMAALDLVRVLEMKMPAATAVEFLSTRDYINLEQQTSYGAIAHTLGIFSKHLHGWKEPTATGWADEQLLSRLVSDEDAFNFWMALVMKQEETSLQKIIIQKSTDSSKLDVTLYDLLNNQIYAKQSYLRETLARFAEVQASAKNLLALSKSDSLYKADAFSQYSAAGFGLLIAGLECIKQADPCSAKPKYDKAMHLLKSGRDLASFAHGKRFGDGISVLLEIVKLIYGVDANDIENSNLKLEGCDKRDEMLNLLRLIDKYGNLMVSCANAKGSDELLAILEKTASPVQSYLKKRGAGRITAAIGMYPGLAVGHEYQLDEGGRFTTKGGTVLAFTTPLGISLDFGICQKSSLSVFASFIDIGAVTAFRLQDNASILPELKWKNVFAPGAYIMIGMGRTPLTLGIGGQYGPALRKVEVNTGIPELEEASHFRAGITLTVDIPVFMVNIGAKKK